MLQQNCEYNKLYIAIYGMRLILMKNNHPTNNICKQRRSPKEEKLMNIDLRGHSWHAAFCHAMRS